jgi:hypothetical protein
MALRRVSNRVYMQSIVLQHVEKHEPASDIDTVMVDGLKALDPNRPISEADVEPLFTGSGALRNLEGDGRIGHRWRDTGLLVLCRRRPAMAVQFRIL